MKQLLAVSLVLAVAVAAVADPYTSAKRQARSAAGKVTQRENETMGAMQQQAPPRAQPQPAPQQPNPALVALQQNINNIAADLGELQKNPARKQTLINNLNVAAQGKSPSKASVTKLAEDLSAALTGKSLSQEQRIKLAQFLRAAFNGSHVAPAQEKMILDQAEKVLLAAGISAETATKVTADFKTVLSETR